MRKLIILGLVLILALLPSSAYTADTPDYTDPTVLQGIMQDLEASDDPHQAFSQLPPAVQQAIMDSIRENVTIEGPFETRSGVVLHCLSRHHYPHHSRG